VWTAFGILSWATPMSVGSLGQTLLVNCQRQRRRVPGTTSVNAATSRRVPVVLQQGAVLLPTLCRGCGPQMEGLPVMATREGGCIWQVVGWVVGTPQSGRRQPLSHEQLARDQGTSAFRKRAPCSGDEVHHPLAAPERACSMRLLQPALDPAMH
jgi:hypothetical protein